MMGFELPRKKLPLYEYSPQTLRSSSALSQTRNCVYNSHTVNLQ